MCVNLALLSDCNGERGSSDCCTKDNPCEVGGGDCDEDDDCAGDLVCGTNNCVEFNLFASLYADCCKSGTNHVSITEW